MTRLLGVLAALAAFALLLWVATPPASAAPVPKSLRHKTPDVTGTVWVSDENEAQLGVIEYTFQEGGKLAYTRQGSGAVSTTGSWKQDGSHLYWEVNQKYVDYNVDFKDDKFEGAALNVRSRRWTIVLRPKVVEEK